MINDESEREREWNEPSSFSLWECFHLVRTIRSIFHRSSLVHSVGPMRCVSLLSCSDDAHHVNARLNNAISPSIDRVCVEYVLGEVGQRCNCSRDRRHRLFHWALVRQVERECVDYYSRFSSWPSLVSWHWPDSIDDRRENDRRERSPVVHPMENRAECRASLRDRRHCVGLVDKGRERMRGESKRSTIQWRKRTVSDDRLDRPKTPDGRFASRRHSSSNGIVSGVRRERSESSIDEHMEYDELDDEARYHKYSSPTGNSHTYRFWVLEPKN